MKVNTILQSLITDGHVNFIVPYMLLVTFWTQSSFIPTQIWNIIWKLQMDYMIAARGWCQVKMCNKKF